ncbi:MAG: hypothetical protein ACFCUR_15360, partial [Rhodomicrobiaceae bacterium]
PDNVFFDGNLFPRHESPPSLFEAAEIQNSPAKSMTQVTSITSGSTPSFSGEAHRSSRAVRTGYP